MSNEALSLPTEIKIAFNQPEARIVNNDVLTWDSTAATAAGGSSTQINTGSGNAVPAAGIIQLANSTGLIGSAADNTLTLSNQRYENDIVFGSTDCAYATLQDAIDAAILAGGGTVRIREGVYNGDITLGNDVILCGAGATDGVNVGAGTIINGTITIPNGTTYCSICDLTACSTNAIGINHQGGGKMVIERVNTHRIYTSFSLLGQITLAANAVVYISNWKSTVTFLAGGPMMHLDFSAMTDAGVLVVDGAVLNEGSIWDSTCSNSPQIFMKNIVTLNSNLLVSGNCRYHISNCNVNYVNVSAAQDDVDATCDITDCKFASGVFNSFTAQTYPTKIRNCVFGSIDLSLGAYRFLNCEVRDNTGGGLLTIQNGANGVLEGCAIYRPTNIDNPIACEYNRTTFYEPVTVNRGPHNFNNCVFKNQVVLSNALGHESTNTFSNCTFVDGVHTPSVSITANGTHVFRNCVLNNRMGVGIDVTNGTNSVQLYNCTMETASHCLQTNNDVQTIIHGNNLRAYDSGECVRFINVSTGGGATQRISDNHMTALLGSTCVRISQVAALGIFITGNSFVSSSAGCVTNSSTNLTSGYNKAIGDTVVLYSGTAPATVLAAMG